MDRPGWLERAGWASGAAFVVLVLVGNSLAVDGTEGGNEVTAKQAASDAAWMADHAVNRIGIALELLAFTAFLVFLGRLATGARGAAARTAVVAGAVMLAEKLTTGGAGLVAVADHDKLSPTELLAVTDIGSVGFVLSWLPYGVFVAALGLAVGGRVTAGLGLLLGALGVVAACVGIPDPGSAVPVPFLLGLVWTLVVSLRLAARGMVPAQA
jgi:hypothetical protein